MNSFLPIIFLLIILSVIFGLHYFLYLFLIKFFNITDSKLKLIIGIIIFILAISFIAYSIIARFYENDFTRFLYFSSGIWIAFIINFEVIIGILLLINLALKKHDLDHNFIIYFGIIFSILFVGYGVFNAFNPEVNSLTIKIKNLPSNWKGKKVVMISDVHLGLVYRDKFMQKIVDKINSINPEAIFIVGDLFDGNEGDKGNLSQYIKPLNILKSKKGIFFVTGNHETYLGIKNTFNILKETNISVLNDQVINLDGIELIGVSYPERGAFKNMKGTLEKLKLDSDLPKILLYHSPLHLNEAHDAKIDLQLSGHTHRGQMFPFNFITSTIYSGHDYGLTNIGDFQIFTSNGVGTWGPAVRTNSKSEIVEITLE